MNRSFNLLYAVTSSQMLKTVAMKNNMHYSKQNTADATHVTATLASLGQQTSRLLLFSRIIGTSIQCSTGVEQSTIFRRV